MTNPVEQALQEALEELPPLHDPDEDGPLPVNSYAAGYEAGLREAREAFPRMWAAAMRSIASAPTPEMVEAVQKDAKVAATGFWSIFLKDESLPEEATERGWIAQDLSAALTALADQVEDRHGG